MTENQEKSKTPILDLTVKVFSRIDDGAAELNNRISKRNWNRIAWTLFGVYVVLHMVISIFHEPWFDEAVAWQISKYASLKDILLVRPHYEGHPPLWHLILFPFARLGCPYELSLSVVSLLFSGTTTALILFKSPFPKPVRMLLPFSYFFFYQYGVISRPYCVMALAFILSAITYKNKDKKPFAFVLSLFLLCLSSAYGILIAGGIAIAWLIEIFRNEKFAGLFVNKKRFLSLFLLLVCALALIAEIFPAEDAYATNNFNQAPFESGIVIRLIYTLLVLPADNVITDIYKSGFLTDAHFDWYNLLCGSVIGIVMWTAMLNYAKKKKTVSVFILPYILFAVFSAVKYMCIYHTGIGLLLFVFWSWISVETDVDNTTGNNAIKEKVVRGMYEAGIAVILIVSLYWSIAASIGEINYSYAAGRNEANFIKEYHLTDYKIYTCYKEYYAYDDETEELTTELLFSDLNHCFGTDSILAYFDNNIFYNFNEGNDSIPYTTHKIKLSTENAELLEKWKADGVPDVILNFSTFEEVFGDEIKFTDYTLVFAQRNRMSWKDTYTVNPSGIYVRKELAEELGLDELNFIEYYMVVQ